MIVILLNFLFFSRVSQEMDFLHRLADVGHEQHLNEPCKFSKMIQRFIMNR